MDLLDFYFLYYLRWKTARIYEPKFLLFFMRIAVLIVIIISTRVVFLRNSHQDLEQGKLMAAVNSRK